MDKMNKIENGNKMKDALAGAAMADGSVDMILKAIEDMQDKVNSDMDDKLKNYTQLPLHENLEADVKAIGRRVGYNENVMKELSQTTEGNAEKIENSRKKMQRMQSEIDALKGGAPVVEAVAPVELSDDGPSVGSGDLDKLQKMIQRVEGNLIRRIATVETSLGRINGLEDKVQDIELLIRRL